MASAHRLSLPPLVTVPAMTLWPLGSVRSGGSMNKRTLIVAAARRAPLVRMRRRPVPGRRAA